MVGSVAEQSDNVAVLLTVTQFVIQEQCKKGNTLLSQGDIPAAKAEFLKNAKDIAGLGVAIPSIAGRGEGGVRTQLYVDMDISQRTVLMAMCNGMAKCLHKEGNLTEALAWLEEVRVLALNCYFAHSRVLFDWIDLNLDLPRMTIEKTFAKTLQADLFLSIGNTGLAAYHRFSAQANLNGCPPSHRTDEMRRIADAGTLVPLLKLRHPDPQMTPVLEITNSELQKQGSWKKLRVKGSSSVLKSNFASFIWKSRLYIAGGKKDLMSPVKDMWSVNLTTLDQWRQEPGYPGRSFPMGWSFVVCPTREKAYLFSGNPRVDFFDLRTNQWGSFITTYERTASDRKDGVPLWPYPSQCLKDYTAQLVDGKIYIFGGSHGKTNIGCSLFMQLDLETSKLTRLSGYVMPTPDYMCPGGRKTPSSWVDGAKERIYLLGGEAERPGTGLVGEPHGAEEGFTYPDFWSWSIKEMKWRRERFAGNYPCPRSEMSCVFNPKMNKAIIFGGYNGSVPSYVMGQIHQFSYYADTFIYDHPQPGSAAPPKWRQVITRGFPTYRCQAHLIVDSTTSKTYLFGGFTNTQHVPCRGRGATQLVSKTFGDLWELRVDTEGGWFEGVNVEEETRTARAGSWERCFTCAKAGRMKKCDVEGTCNGKAFFCDSDCLKEGWSEHKQIHACRIRK